MALSKEDMEELVRAWKQVLIMGAITGVAVLVECVVNPRMISPLLASDPSWERYVGYALVSLVAARSVYNDVQSGLDYLECLRRFLISVMAAWIVLVPFGRVLCPFAPDLWFVTVVGLGFLLGVLAFVIVAGNGWCRGAAFCIVFLGSLYVAGNCRPAMKHVNVFLMIVVFGFVSWLSRLLSNVADDLLAGGVSSWPGVTEVDEDSEEFREKRDFFEASCAQYSHKYKIWLQVVKIYRVDVGNVGASNRGLLGAGAEDSIARTSNGRLLFHGTPHDSAKGIIENHFRLPTHAGMFGKGIYFADCPLKSFQYTGGQMWIKNGLILMCWVELGHSKNEKTARKSYTDAPRRTFTEWLTKKPVYESVTGTTHEEGGSLRVPEYIIYKPAQAQVDYIFDVRSVLPGHAPEPKPAPGSP